jgi:hypothetical protein
MISMKAKESGRSASSSSTSIPPASRTAHSQNGVAVLSSLASSAPLMLGWLHWFFLHPLGQEAIDMVPMLSLWSNEFSVIASVRLTLVFC